MRRSQLVLLMLLMVAATTSAQNPVVIQGVPMLVAQATAPDAHASPDEVVARLMSFDRNSDGKVAKDELLERMENLVTRGDANGDGVLDDAEIRALAEQPPAQVAVRGFQAGHYSFGDESGQSSRLHIEGALEDLRLASPAKEEALAVVKAFVDTRENTASAILLEEMQSVLTAEQLDKFKVAVSRQSQIRTMTFGNNSGVVASRVFIVLMDLNRTIEQYKLPAAQQARALAAIERFKNELRLGDAERSALLEQMQGILSDEERDNFRAALERRPVVKAGVVLDVVDSFQGGVLKPVVGGR